MSWVRHLGLQDETPGARLKGMPHQDWHRMQIGLGIARCPFYYSTAPMVQAIHVACPVCFSPPGCPCTTQAGVDSYRCHMDRVYLGYGYAKD